MLIAYECIHYLKRKKGKTGACAVKLDMAKAYDRVEWENLRRIMLKLGFHGDFVHRIMRCVSSVSFSIKINGNLSQPFRPSRGIRLSAPICFCCVLKDYLAFLGVLVQCICQGVSNKFVKLEYSFSPSTAAKSADSFVTRASSFHISNPSLSHRLS